MPTRVTKHDPLYGEISLPGYLSDILNSWHVCRLRYVRLLNVHSLALPPLGETSRYTHTLGALHLASILLRANGVSEDDQIARLLFTALCLHDAGTPAFGHSLERFMAQPHSMDHVGAVLLSICGRTSVGPFNWREVPRRRPDLSLRRTLKRLLGPDFANLLREALCGRGPVGPLVSAPALDLDNADNVFRMAVMLGLAPSNAAQHAVALASAMTLPQSDGLTGLVCQSIIEEHVTVWLELRQRVYDVLHSHPDNLAGLAMLHELFQEYALTVGQFPISAWWTTDEEALQFSTLPHTQALASRIRAGRLYRTLCCAEIDLSFGDLDPLLKCHLHVRELSELLAEELDSRVRVHAVLDERTSSRRVSLSYTDHPGSAEIGGNSRKVLLSAHAKTPSSASVSATAAVGLLDALETQYKVPARLLWMRVKFIYPSPLQLAHQRKLFSTSGEK